MYFRARYMDPALGTFVSPDTLVPEPGVVFDYNRYMYVRGNALKFADPMGHIPHQEACKYLNACDYDAFANLYGEELAKLLWDTDISWGDKLEWGDTNVGMLLLMEDGAGHHHGVLWGIEGAKRGNPISLRDFQDAEKQGFDITAKSSTVKAIHDLVSVTNYSPP